MVQGSIGVIDMIRADGACAFAYRACSYDEEEEQDQALIGLLRKTEIRYRIVLSPRCHQYSSSTSSSRSASPIPRERSARARRGRSGTVFNSRYSWIRSLAKHMQMMEDSALQNAFDRIEQDVRKVSERKRLLRLVLPWTSVPLRRLRCLLQLL